MSERSVHLQTPLADELDLSNEELRAQLREARATLDAIRNGDIDAVMVGLDGAREAYTLTSADRPYRVLVEQMQEGAVLVSADGTLVYCNDRAADIVGQPTERIVGRCLTEFVPCTDRERLSALIEDSKLATVRGEIAFSAGDRVIPVLISFKSFALENGRDQLSCGVITDLTQQRATEQRLHQAQKMEAVGQLTGGLAHDFNNLLQAIYGNLELVRRFPVNTDKVRGWAENGIRAVDRGTRLTAQLLAFSRSQKVELLPVDVSRLVRGMDDLFVRTLGPSVAVELQLREDGAVAFADATQLELAVLNLAINARDAMPDGGSLRIATALRTVRSHSQLDDGEYVELTVTDTGTGMSKDVATRAFEPFFTTKDVGSGTGLGLAQVYGICQQAGGIANIESDPGRGTTVSLLLRQHAGAPDSAVHTLAKIDGVDPANAPTILVVDDDSDVRAFIIEALSTLGYCVEYAFDGNDALAKLQGVKPDLLIVDFAMPHMNGAEFVRQSRQQGVDVPVLFASGYADTSAISAVMEANVMIIRKPFTIGDLAEAVRRSLHLKRA